METLSNIQCFVRSAEAGSFAEAARRLGLTPAGVGKNVARLESNLGVRLFQRSTRRLTLTEAGSVSYKRSAAAWRHPDRSPTSPASATNPAAR